MTHPMLRMPPEWHPQDWLWIGFPHDPVEWPGFLGAAQEQIAAFASAVATRPAPSAFPGKVTTAYFFSAAAGAARVNAAAKVRRRKRFMEASSLWAAGGGS